MRSNLRKLVVHLFRLFLVVQLVSIPTVWEAQLWGQDPASRDATAWDARSIAILLLNSYPEITDSISRTGLRAAVATYDAGWAMIAQAYDRSFVARTELTQERLRDGDELFRQSTDQIAAVLGRLPALTMGGADATVAGETTIPFGSTALLLRRQIGVKPLHFVHKRVDLSSGLKVQTIDVGSAGDFFCVLELVNPASNSPTADFAVMNGPDLLGKLRLTVSVPPRYSLQVRVVDSNGRPLDAAVGLYSSGDRFLVPQDALDFSGAGYFYQPVRYRDCAHASYWPGVADFSSCFFVHGGFTLRVPTGSYRLMAAKGPEYWAIQRTIKVSPKGSNTQSIVLHRWINMASRGWYSGDTHFHFARPDPATNRNIQLWTQAEDLRMVNVLRMGDGRTTYFEQYGFGKAGRYVDPSLAIVPGQEDPRTSIVGHIIGLDLQEPVREVEQGYYVYRRILDLIHQQGGLAGYAHITTYPRSSGAYRDMAINVPEHKVDFVEICENGEVHTDIYYDFLNLGFRLTAMGGSDVPWGGTAGESRAYVYGGSTFDPDRWFAEVKKGHTFVTAGPMLEFSVAGRLPGDEITARPGDKLSVHAKAMVGSSRAPLVRLEVVADGDVIRWVVPHGRSATLDFDLTVSHSMWIAARVSGAHSTPVYLTVNGKRHWKQDAVPVLLSKCSKALDEIDDLAARQGKTIGLSRDGEWENVESFREGSSELRQQVQQAREVYNQLRREWEAETSK